MRRSEAGSQDDRIQRLILRRCRHIALARQMRQESPYLVLVASGRMILAPEREAANPMDVGFLRLHGHVLEAQDVARCFDGLV